MGGMHKRGRGVGEAAGHSVQEREKGAALRDPADLVPGCVRTLRLCGCHRSARIRAGGRCSRNCTRAGARRPVAPRAEQSAESVSKFANASAGARAWCTALTRLGICDVVRGGGLAAEEALKGARGGRHERGEARGAQPHGFRSTTMRFVAIPHWRVVL